MADKKQIERQRKIIREEHKEYIDKQVELMLAEIVKRK